jgi:putative ABC transport system substrate-binding protein
MSGPKKAQNPNTRIVVCLIVSGLLLAACGSTTPTKTYTIGVVNYVPVLSPVFDGFKAQMAALGYVKGKNVTYIYHGVLKPTPQVIEREVKRLLDQKVDLVLTLGTLPALAAKKVLTGTNVPVVFAPSLNPVQEGIVESVSRPGGNITGVQNGYGLPKSLEWLHKIVPQATTVYVIYHPQDDAARTSIKPLPATASSLGIALVLDPVRSPEEARATIETLPKDAAIFLVPTPSLEPLSALIEVAVQRGIAVGVNNSSHLQAGGVVSYGADFVAVGQQAARLADQVLQGTKPADLPVETVEYFLRINLKAATAIGLDIPEEFLRQADTVIR